MFDRVTGMQVFVRVATLGSLSAAARALGMSQTMATKHMAALEGQLRHQVVHRTTRRLTLTEAGRNYLEASERILGEIEKCGFAHQLKQQRCEVLRLNAPVSWNREMRRCCPNWQHNMPSLLIWPQPRWQVDLIEEGWDLVVRIGAMKNTSMIAQRSAPAGWPCVLRRPISQSTAHREILPISKSTTAWATRYQAQSGRTDGPLAKTIRRALRSRAAFAPTMAMCLSLRRLPDKALSTRDVLRGSRNSSQSPGAAQTRSRAYRTRRCVCRLSLRSSSAGKSARHHRFSGRTIWSSAAVGAELVRLRRPSATGARASAPGVQALAGEGSSEVST